MTIHNRYQAQAEAFVKEDAAMQEALKLVRELKLPEGCIAAGFVRNYIWNRLHGRDGHGLINDTDVVYFDPVRVEEDRDHEYESILMEQNPYWKWSVKNQARMHLRNGAEPYQSVEDALSRWVETATAVGVRLNDHNELEWVIPWGLQDLMELKIRKSPKFHDEAYYYARVNAKQWLNRWPKLVMVEASHEHRA